MHALGLEFGSVAQLSKRPGSVWNCLWGNALKRSPGIIRKSRVSYPGPGFLSSATWPSLPKKHYNGLKTKIKWFAWSVSHAIGCRFMPQSGHTKDHKNSTICLACVRIEVDSAARLFKRVSSVWNCLWGHALKRSPGINCKSRVLYPGPGFLSSAIWPSISNKHYNGVINQSFINYHLI